MNLRNLIIVGLFFYSCKGSIGAGTLGAWKVMELPVTESKLDSAMNVFFIDNPEYTVPEKWKYESESWKRSGYDFLKSRLFYFKSAPEEMFYVSYIESGFGVENPGWARIAIRSVYTEKMGWKKNEQYSEEERVRIQNRFDEKIRSKLEQYTSIKTSIEE